jgi:hypothetical protein
MGMRVDRVCYYHSDIYIDRVCYLVPTLAVPVDNTTLPLTPLEPALAVCRSKLPDDASLL